MWLDRWVKALVRRPSTLARYQSVVDRLKLAPLAGVPLQKILPAAIEGYYAELLKTLAPGTVRVHHAVLHKALKKAIKDRLLTHSPAADLENKPKAPKDRGEQARVHCWTATEARAFLAVSDAAGTQPAAFYMLAIDSGARLRELAGLKWEDVDLDGDRITIRHQLLPGASEAPAWGPTKTGTARTFSITPETVTRLRAHRQRQAEIKMKNRTRYQDFGLVFAKEHAHVRQGKDSLGQPLQVNNIGEREFAQLIAAAGVRRIKFHGLRHTCATLLLANGEPPNNVAAQLGHSRTSMTLDVYGHATERQAATTMRAVLCGS
jgi:integrase